MRLASYNVENLFQRAVALNQDTWEGGREVLEKFREFNDLLNRETYTPAVKAKILEMLEFFELERDDTGPFVILRQNRQKLLKRPKNQPPEVIADGRGDWIGWVELTVEQVNERAIRNTAQVIRDVNADVMAVVEAEHRPSLNRFNQVILPASDTNPYDEVMLIDGNDDRGIDVGLLTRSGYRISDMRSHVADKLENKVVFDRDCPEYLVLTPGGNRLWVLVNHFKSKGYGSPSSSNAKRKRQALRVRQIYDQLIAQGEQYVAVVGDLNDTPNSDPLSPLLAEGSTIRDLSQHPSFNDGGRPGTYGNCTASQKIDYLLLSPQLSSRVTAGGIFRKGIWGGVNGTLWEIYPEMEKKVHQASDHAAVWADINLP